MIITLAQAKALLGITGTSKDTLMTALVPEAEAKYLQIRNIPFMQIKGDVIASDKTVSNIRLYPDSDVSRNCEFQKSTVNFIDRMDYLFNSALSIDNYVTDIDSVNNTLELDTAPSSTTSDVIFTVYPKGSKYVASKLISYLSQANAMNGLSGETVGSYTWSAQSTQNPYGVPIDIVNSIKRYIKA